MSQTPGAQAATLASPAAAATTAVLLPAATRRGGVIFNEGSTILYLAFAATASLTAYTVQVPVNGSYQLDPAIAYGGPISGIWAGSPTGSARTTVW